MSHVIRASESQQAEVLTRERCYIRERLNSPEVPEISVADSRVPPGVLTELHRLQVDEWYIISSGEGMMEVDRRAPVRVGPGDTVVIPCGVAQRIRNCGDSDLRFECICRPRFVPECYESLE
jgi:mannose-6-phosphate isomerase-like protein (cupin superfamily)